MAVVLSTPLVLAVLHAQGLDVAAFPFLIMVLLLLRSPDYLILLFLALTVGISYPSHPILVIPGSTRGLSAVEIILLVLLASSMMHMRQRKESGPGATAVGRAFMLYTGWLLYALFWQVVVRGQTEVNATRGYFLLLATVPCAVLLTTDRQWFTLFGGMATVAVISGIFTLLIHFGVGEVAFWRQLAGSFRIDEQLVEGGAGPPRVLLGGVYPVYVLGIAGLALAGVGAGKFRWFVMAVFALSVLFLSSTRSLAGMFVVSLLGIFLVALFWNRSPVRPNGIAIPAVLVAALAGVLFSVLSGDFTILAERYLPLVSVGSLSDILVLDSMSGRTWENAMAFRYLAEDPIFGGGFGISLLDQSAVAASAVPHNAFVSLLYLFGVPGCAFFLLLAGTYTVTTIHLLRSDVVPAIHRAWLFGFLASFLGFLVASIAAQYVTVKAAPLVALMVAYTIFLKNRYRAPGKR
jgi:hypothetical protein